MRICLLGDFRPTLDEGYTNVASNLARELANRHEVIKLNPWRPFSASFWRNIGKSCPDIIHYLTAPSIFSFWMLRALTLYWRNAKTIMSALHPDGFSLQGNIAFRRSILTIKPDLVLTHSQEMEEMFTRFGYKTGFLANGVDVQRFRPRSTQSKKQLRKKYGIDPEKFIILHVGHIKRDRNVQFLGQVQHEERQVVIVGSTYRGGGDERLYQELSQSGCIIWKSYFQNIEEIYALADCYLFPSQGDGCLLLPLSVMEAMACNLPIVTTRFGALPTMFQEGEGLFFAEKETSFLNLLDRIKRGDVEVNTRQKVLPYTWEKVTEELERIYTNIMDEDEG